MQPCQFRQHWNCKNPAEIDDHVGGSEDLPVLIRPSCTPSNCGSFGRLPPTSIFLVVHTSTYICLSWVCSLHRQRCHDGAMKGEMFGLTRVAVDSQCAFQVRWVIHFKLDGLARDSHLRRLEGHGQKCLRGRSWNGTSKQ